MGWEIRQKLEFSNGFSHRGSNTFRGSPREPGEVVTTVNPKKSGERSQESVTEWCLEQTAGTKRDSNGPAPGKRGTTECRRTARHWSRVRSGEENAGAPRGAKI